MLNFPLELELIPIVRKSLLDVCGLFILLEDILYGILLGNVAYRGIISSHAYACTQST